MPHLNNFQFMGHVGRAPELKQAAGKQLAEFSVAVSSGTVQKPDTIWVKCSVWGERSQKVVEKISKGDAVYISGRLSLRTYQGKDGQTKAEASVMVNEWQCLTKKSEPLNHSEQQSAIDTFGVQFASTVPVGAGTDDLDPIPF